MTSTTIKYEIGDRVRVAEPMDNCPQCHRPYPPGSEYGTVVDVGIYASYIVNLDTAGVREPIDGHGCGLRLIYNAAELRNGRECRNTECGYVDTSAVHVDH